MKQLEFKKTQKGCTVYLVGDKKVRLSKKDFEQKSKIQFHRQRFRKFYTVTYNGQPISIEGKSQWSTVGEINNHLDQAGYIVQNKGIVKK